MGRRSLSHPPLTRPPFSRPAEEPDVRTRKIVKVVTQTMINGKVVDESSEVEQIEETKKWEEVVMVVVVVMMVCGDDKL